MSITKTWGYGTDAASTYELNPSVIAPTSWTLVRDDQVKDGTVRCQLSHRVAPDNQEMVTYDYKPVGGVGTYLKSANKVKAKDSVSYTIRLDEQLKLTSTDDSSYAETVPVVAQLTIRHPLNGNLASADIDTIFKRLIGACFKSVGGVTSTRFEDMMAGGVKPTADGPSGS